MPSSKLEYDRICEAYLTMAEYALYRPAAPSDGMGNIQLTTAQLAEPERLANEAHDYAVNFIAEENSCTYEIGISDYSTNRALVYTIEAARQLCTGVLGRKVALKLLEMALADVKQA